MKSLYISEIQLVSQKEKKAGKTQFDQQRTLILGKNHTGKSSLIKSIYHTLGAEVLLHPKFVDARVSTLLKFSIDQEEFQILREGDRFALFDDASKLIKKFSSVSKELGPYFSNLFNFKPLFQSHKNEFVTPPPAFLFLPFYVDQDKSWTKSWDAFQKLSQFKDPRTQSINYHSGIRPNEYYETKKEIERHLRAMEELEKERKITSSILTEIKGKLNIGNFNVNIESFKEEIKELLVECEKLKRKEESLKLKLLELYNIKTTIECQVEIVKQAIKESNKDLSFASVDLPHNITCPTCGADYENSFVERFEIAKDEQKSRDLYLELIKELNATEKEIGIELEKLKNTTSEVLRIEAILAEKKGEIQLKDVLDNFGKNQVKDLFQERNSNLSSSLYKTAQEKDVLDKKLKGLENKNRKESILDTFKLLLRRYLDLLDVHSLNEVDYKSILAKIEEKELGSSRPRALIAYYFSFFYLMQKFSTSTYCPLIIDSPNQQDQDIEHIDKIMGFINDNQPKNTQLILGLAETYGVDFHCNTIELTEKYSLLQDSEYEEVMNTMSTKLEFLWLL
jgi:uncharacterized protein (UPF0212 family)